VTLGVDVGGTFTDLVWWDGASVRTSKTSSTPDQSDGVIAGATALLGGEATEAFLHGTTVATNALLERRGASVALVTTAGFEDVIEIARQDRPSLYDSTVSRADPLVDRAHRFGIRRLDAGESWGEDEIAEVVRSLRLAGTDSVAVSLLYGYAQPDQERRLAEAIAGGVAPQPGISLSSTVVPEFREYERTSTTVVNAFLSPETSTYLRHLRERSEAARLPGDIMVMRSSGGLIPIETAADLPAAILLSGPAGGVVAAAAIGDAVGCGRVISFDMGGTSTDVARIENGVPEVSYERSIEGIPVRMPSIAIHTVGAGGGSVGWVDAGGALRVGPRSAGANPGPAAYGRGGIEPTVTDANLHLGRIGHDTRLGGTLELDARAASTAMVSIGERLALSTDATAEGMLEIVEAHMERAIRQVSVEEGADPRGAHLLAFGGAGGLHATALARRLDMAGVVIPAFAGVFSAFGLLLSPPRIDLATSRTIARDAADQLRDALAQIHRGALARFADDIGQAPRQVQLRADARYVGQAHETSVDVEIDMSWDAMAERFHKAHYERNGFSRPQDPVEVVTVRAAALGQPALRLADVPAHTPAGEPRRGTRGVRTSTGEAQATVWWRPALATGTAVVGPAIIEEAEATTYLAPGERATVHDSGALVIEW
jgi:N-methylhydantoinase A